jgi:aminobenzoyl-glutamate utilization protein B
LAARAVEAVKDPILKISREVWQLAELSLAEVKSSAVHMRELKVAGFRVVSVGTSGTPTAFLMEWSQGSGGAKVGFLPEYDALPELSNVAEPRQDPGAGGLKPGHGCGHNLLGAGCTGAAIALKRMMEQNNIPGTIRVYGCAAEETEGVKVYMARDGLFDDLDACIAWHPTPIAVIGALKTAATNNIKIRFRGRTAHAGISPWDGRSALKAAELFAQGINLMREHVLPTARLHYIYETAGTAPNVVPEFSELWLVIRDANRQGVDSMTQWAGDIAKGAALSTQTISEFQVFHGMYDLVPNDVLIDRIHRHMMATPLDWSAEEQTFARTCQKAMNLPEAGLTTEVLRFPKEITAGGSTDVGDISYITPVGIFGWPTVPLGTSLHTWAVTACGGMSIGEKGAISSARIMAGLGYDIMTDADLRSAAKADLERRRGANFTFRSALPPEQKSPIGIPDFIRRGAQDEIMSPLINR